MSDMIDGSFVWALAQLLQGKKVSRLTWRDDPKQWIRSIYVDKDGPDLRAVPRRTTGTTGHMVWVPRSADLFATDWMIHVR